MPYKIIIYAIRNEHVMELPIYPFLTGDIFVASENFNKKYGYLPTYIYTIKDQPNTMYVVVNPEYTGDNNELQIIHCARKEPDVLLEE